MHSYDFYSPNLINYNYNSTIFKNLYTVDKREYKFADYCGPSKVEMIICCDTKLSHFHIALYREVEPMSER